MKDIPWKVLLILTAGAHLWTAAVMWEGAWWLAAILYHISMTGYFMQMKVQLEKCKNRAMSEMVRSVLLPEEIVGNDSSEGRTAVIPEDLREQLITLCQVGEGYAKAVYRDCPSAMGAAYNAERFAVARARLEEI